MCTFICIIVRHVLLLFHVCISKPNVSMSISYFHVSDNSCHLDLVMALWYAGESWFHGIIHNCSWCLWLKLKLLDEAHQKEKQLCLGQALSWANPLANLERNHPLIPLILSSLHEPCWVKLAGIYPGLLSHHDFIHAW